MAKIIYKENQTFLLVWIACFLGIIITIITTFIPLENANPSEEYFPKAIFYLILLFFLTLFMLFYNMKIMLTKSSLVVKFGIGLFKKKINVSEIDNESLSIDMHSMWNGLGWRYKLNGDLILSTKFEKSVSFKTYTTNKTYHIVTSNYLELKDKITEAYVK